MEMNTETQDLANILANYMQPQILKGDVVSGLNTTEFNYALVPKGMELKSLKPLINEYLPRPERRKGTARTDDLISFIGLVNRFAAENSVIFGQRTIGVDSINASLTAVLNYHPNASDNTVADNNDHRIVYKFPVSKEFQAWLDNNRGVMSQGDFSYFLEDRISDLAAPNEDDRTVVQGLNPNFADPVDMLELSRELEVYKNESFKNKTRLQSGETEIKFTTEHVDSSGKPVTIPDFFVISLPIFESGDAVRIPVRLRYRVKDGMVVWFYDLYRIDQVFAHAFKQALELVAKETDLPVFIGQPEG